MVGILIVHGDGRTRQNIAVVAAVETGDGANDRAERRYWSLIMIPREAVRA